MELAIAWRNPRRLHIVRRCKALVHEGPKAIHVVQEQSNRGSGTQWVYLCTLELFRGLRGVRQDRASQPDAVMGPRNARAANSRYLIGGHE